MTKKLSAFILTLLLVFVLPISVSANSAEPPGMTIIVEGAPDDISLSLELTEEPEYEIRIHKAQKNWEIYFYLYYYFAPGTLDGAVIRVESSEKSFSCPLPEDVPGRYNNLLTLDFETQTLTLGQRWWRQPVLTAVRITLTLLVEGLIFFAFGFRNKRSWIVFFAVNLVTQGWLNYIINGSAFSSGYWVLGLYLAEFVIFNAEAIAFTLATKEKKKWQCLLYALAANTASLIAGHLLIRYLPI
ncbi:MAG: hypothetical protein J6A88_05640 [Oscillospiraceae bacterium]|nr:hypothetical protein [Oscillospiraceae bacterium]